MPTVQPGFFMPKLPPVKRFEASNGVRVYRIPCQVFDYLSARVYLLLGAGPPTLVDTGSGQGESTAQILAGLKTVRTEFGESVRPPVPGLPPAAAPLVGPPVGSIRADRPSGL